MKEYTVIYEHGPGNWSACVPDLPGSIATGKTRGAVEIQMQEAMEFHIEGLWQHGKPVPEPTIEAGKIFLATWRNCLNRSRLCAGRSTLGRPFALLLTCMT